MEYCLFRTIGKYTFCIIECARPRALNMPNISFFHTSDYLHSADSLKNIFEIPPFFNSQISGENTWKLRVFFLHTTAALQVKNRVQFVWAKWYGVWVEALLVVVGWGGRGWVLCRLGVRASLWVVWVLRVCAVWPLRFLTGCGAGVRVGGDRMSPRVGLWSVCDGWLLVDGARWYGVWVGGLLVVVGRPYSVLVLPVCVRGSSRVHGGVPWLVCRGPV